MRAVRAKRIRRSTGIFFSKHSDGLKHQGIFSHRQLYRLVKRGYSHHVIGRGALT